MSMAGMCTSTTHLASSTRLGRLSHLHSLSTADLLEDFKLDLVRRSTCWNPIPSWACFTVLRNGTMLGSQGQVKVDLQLRSFRTLQKLRNSHRPIWSSHGLDLWV